MASAATRKGVLGVVLSGMGMLVCGGALAMQTLRVQNDIAKDKAKYERETNPIGRAKALTKLGRAEYLAARQSLDAGNIRAAFEFLTNYNEQAITAHDALEKMGVDPEKHSNGFRQLQISVRERLRELREITSSVPFQQRQSFEALEKDLDALDQKLILELFPRQPGHKFDDEKKHR